MKNNWFVEWFKIYAWIQGKGVWQVLSGVYKMADLQEPRVSIFGGKGAKKDDKYAKMAYELAQHCVKHGMSVLTGGGPGIMEAANCGAFDESMHRKKTNIQTLGVGVQGVDVRFTNPCAPMVMVDYLFLRKWFLIRYSQAFVVLPGGIGTISELFDVLDQIKLKRIERMPVILVGRNFWQPMIDWYSQAGQYGYIKPEYLNLFLVVDTIDEVMNILINRLGLGA